mmetsp:Transcript_8020/g.20991  ORF Transcript_8020/g.20991 Transcript_8020/m.20991 type:complete len:245 (-) Transcript_8020:85-819(-)
MHLNLLYPTRGNRQWAHYQSVCCRTAFFSNFARISEVLRSASIIRAFRRVRQDQTDSLQGYSETHVISENCTSDWLGLGRLRRIGDFRQPNLFAPFFDLQVERHRLLSRLLMLQPTNADFLMRKQRRLQRQLVEFNLRHLLYLCLGMLFKKNVQILDLLFPIHHPPNDLPFPGRWLPLPWRGFQAGMIQAGVHDARAQVPEDVLGNLWGPQQLDPHGLVERRPSSGNGRVQEDGAVVGVHDGGE